MSYQENRVRVSTFGTLPSTSPLLIPVPTAPNHAQQRLHKLAARAFLRLSGHVKAIFGFPLLAASGWRPHRWASKDEYARFLLQRYGSITKGRLYVAFDSPHETGLAVDIGCGGLEPNTRTINTQKTAPLFRWLVDHAWEHGWTPYKVEPWHWEYNLSLASYRSGVADEAPPPCMTPDEALACALDDPVCEDYESMDPGLVLSAKTR